MSNESFINLKGNLAMENPSFFRVTGIGTNPFTLTGLLIAAHGCFCFRNLIQQD